jgi:hypothetical protein
VILGFTGTRQGALPPQALRIRSFIENLKPSEVHHGCCMGADEMFHLTCLQLKIPLYLHPGVNHEGKCPTRMYSFDLTKDKVVKVFDEKPFLDRDRDIVDACDVLLAAPKGKEEELRSGTWATIRYAKKVGKIVVLVYPDGSYEKIVKG